MKPYECSVCKKRFTESGSLERHDRIHQGVKPYECSVCRKRFTQSGHLKRHERIHQGVEPYECSVCKELFTESSHLKTHERIHQGVKPYNKCSVSKRKSSQSQSRHGVEPNILSPFEKGESCIVQNLELEENEVLQKRQTNEQILSQEPIDIKTEVTVSESEYTELKVNDSEFSEEISIEKEEIPSDTEYGDNRICQANKLNADCESVYDSSGEEEYVGEGSTGIDSSALLFHKQKDNDI